MIRWPQLVDALKLGKGCVMYRLPGHSNLEMIIGKFIPTDYRSADFDEHEGFIVNDFLSAHCFFISGESSLTISREEIAEILQPQVLVKLDPGEITNYIQTKAEYLEEVERLKKNMAASKVEKVVLSRIHPIESPIDLCATFTALLGRYPDVFGFLLYSPETGCWMGATPEKLLNSENGIINIHALAGTMPSDNINWTEKEYEEQQLVTDFITRNLKEHGFADFSTGERETVSVGPVAHLRTTISIPRIANKLSALVKLLHPTPAVCGLPKEQARKLILQTEKHERKLYTGFLGTTGKKAGLHLFVNLRCMQLTRHGAHIFAGGGITARSVPENEWEETEIKTKALINIIQRRQL